MTAYTTKGERLTYEVEATRGTDPASSPKDVRVQEPPTIADPFESSIQPTTVYANVHESDAPIQINESQDGAVSIKVGLHQASSGTSFLTTALKAGGYTEAVAASDTTIKTATTPAVDSIELTDDVGGIGQGQHVYNTATELYHPVLTADYSSSVITPAMDLASAPSVGDAVLKASTIYPGSPAEVGTTLSFNHITRAMESTKYVKAQARGCVLETAGDIVIEMNTAPTCDLTFRAAYLTTNDLVSALGDNDFNDVEARLPVNCDSYWEYANANAAGGITRSILTVYKGTFKWGWSTTSVPGFGGSVCVGGTQADIAGPTDEQKRYIFELEVPFDYGYVDDWEGTNPAKHIAFVQPGSSADNLGWSITMPNATLVQKPVWDKANPEHRMTLTYCGAGAGYDGAGDDDAGDQPYYVILPTA